MNFARPDWLEFGRECVENCKFDVFFSQFHLRHSLTHLHFLFLADRSYSKAPVFDHNELLISIAEHSHTIDTSIWRVTSFSFRASLAPN